MTTVYGTVTAEFQMEFHSKPNEWAADSHHFKMEYIEYENIFVVLSSANIAK